MNIYTIGFTQKTAREFFEPIKKNDIQVLIDVRLNNQSQLAGFTKEKDLSYFLENITNCKYVHDLVFAPPKMLLDDYKKGKTTWDGYVEVFQKLIVSRKMVEHFDEKYKTYDGVLLMCSEPTPEKCHRRLIAEALATQLGHKIIHL